MALLAELGPLFAFALTVGVSASVTLGAHALHRRGDASFGSALRVALLAAGVLSLLGAVVWTVARGSPRGGSVTPLVAVFVAFLASTVLPLAAGRYLVRRASDADSDAALRFAAYGWPVAMLAAFGVYVAYWLLAQDIYHPGSGQICVVGRCTGITVASSVTVLAGLLVAVLGTGLAGVGLRASATKR